MLTENEDEWEKEANTWIYSDGEVCSEEGDSPFNKILEEVLDEVEANTICLRQYFGERPKSSELMKKM